MLQVGSQQIKNKKLKNTLQTQRWNIGRGHICNKLEQEYCK